MGEVAKGKPTLHPQDQRPPRPLVQTEEEKMFLLTRPRLTMCVHPRDDRCRWMTREKIIQGGLHHRLSSPATTGLPTVTTTSMGSLLREVGRGGHRRGMIMSCLIQGSGMHSSNSHTRNSNTTRRAGIIDNNEHLVSPRHHRRGAIIGVDRHHQVAMLDCRIHSSSPPADQHHPSSIMMAAEEEEELADHRNIISAHHMTTTTSSSPWREEKASLRPGLLRVWVPGAAGAHSLPLAQHSSAPPKL